jgi:hypothetical protein
MDDFKAGLRCHDLHMGLRNVDPNSPTVAPLSDTRVIGMAAGMAALIRGQEVVEDASALRIIVAEQLDISPHAFKEVIDLLEKVEFIRVTRQGNKVVSLTETVPFHERRYEELGEAWRGDSPSQIEEEMVAVIERLAFSPLPAEDLEDDLGLDRSDIPRLLELGEASEIIRTVTVSDGKILYSPFYPFENPELFAES